MPGCRPLLWREQKSTWERKANFLSVKMEWFRKFYLDYGLICGQGLRILG